MFKILVFLAFLTAYCLWTWAATWAFKKMPGELLTGRSFWSGELDLLRNLAALFGFIYLLSGLWSFQLVILFFIAAHLGGLVSVLLTEFLGAHSKEASIRTFWAGQEVGMKFPILTFMGLVPAIFATLSYPIVGGLFYFRYAWSSQVLKLLIVKYSLILLILSGYPLAMIIVISMISSENLDEDTRQVLFIGQLASLIPAALWVALAIWAFGIGGTDLPFDFAGVRHTLSVQSLLSMLVFFAIFVLIPYVLGTKALGDGT